MGIRNWLGLCEHKWEPTGNLIQLQKIRIVDSHKYVTGFIDVRVCEKCGVVRGFKL